MKSFFFTLLTLCLLGGISPSFAQRTSNRSGNGSLPKSTLSRKAVVPPIRDIQVQIDVSKVKYLGNLLLDSLKGMYGDTGTKPEIAKNFKSQKTPFQTYLYNDLFIIQTSATTAADIATLASKPSQDWELYYTVRALQLFQTNYPTAYSSLITSSQEPNLTLLDNNNYNWVINKFSKVVISFTDAYGGIAISGTQFGQTKANVDHQGRMYNVYRNLPIISISPKLIKGTDPAKGSYPIYKRPKPEDNFSLYMKEGLLHTIVHELIHRAIDVRNNDRRTVYNYIYFGAGRSCNVPENEYNHPLYDVEEIVLIHTLNQYFQRIGGLSPELLAYYNDTATKIKSRIGSFYYTHYLQKMHAKSEFNSSSTTYKLLD